MRLFDLLIIAAVHLSFLLCVAMIAVVIKKCGRSQIRSAFLFVLGVITVWCAGTLLEQDYRLVTGVTRMFFINICYIGVCVSPVAILYLGMALMRSDINVKPVYSAFLIIPLISVVMVFTDPYHHLFFANFSLNSSEAVYGPYYYFHSAYSYGCIAAGIILMLIASVSNSGLFSVQSMFVILGVVMTLSLNVLYSFGVIELPFSINAAAFTLSILCFAVAFLKYRFITALPITLRQVVDLISDGYILIDRQCWILDRNRALLGMFPDPSASAPGTDLRNLFERYFLSVPFGEFTELRDQAVSRRATVSAEWPLSGDSYAGVDVTPVFSRNDHIGCIVLIRDITRQRLVIEAAKAESRYKSEFLSNMSHEIRTPMNTIIGMASIGASAAGMERKDYCLKKIEDASKHLLGVINDVLDVSKIEAGKLALTPGVFDFKKMIGRVVNVVKFGAEEKEQQLTTEFDEALPESLIGDAQRLAQVVTNLIGNAVKFTPRGGRISFEARLLEETDGECTLKISVTDTGIGVTRERQATLFLPYEQVESGGVGGTGLGLSISKSIVEMMGGSIWVESEPGCGSSFIFTVRLTRGDETAGDESEGEDAPDLTGRRVLLADDVDINREIVVTLLEPTHLSIDCAADGAEAVRMYTESPERYEMIFMDVQMPVMDGCEATRAIRALGTERAGSVPIIAMTANVFREDVQKYLEAGMDGHVGKPIVVDEVYGQLRRYLHGPKADGAAE